MLDGSVSEPSIVTLKVKEKDRQAKQKMKENADKRARARVSIVAVGDTVLVRQRKRNKFTTRFDPSPFEVVRIKGTMVTAARNEKYITRNISQFKKIPSLLKELEGEESDISDDDISEDGEEENNPPDTPHTTLPPAVLESPVVGTSNTTRACPIMLKILPIMLFSNSQYLCLLFPRKYPLFPTILSDIQWKRVILPPAGLFH